MRSPSLDHSLLPPLFAPSAGPSRNSSTRGTPASSKTNVEEKREHHRPSPQITHRARRSMRPCPCIGTRFHLLRTASKMHLLQEGACAGLKSTTGHCPQQPAGPSRASRNDVDKAHKFVLLEAQRLRPGFPDHISWPSRAPRFPANPPSHGLAGLLVKMRNQPWHSGSCPAGSRWAPHQAGKMPRRFG